MPVGGEDWEPVASGVALRGRADQADQRSVELPRRGEANAVAVDEVECDDAECPWVFSSGDQGCEPAGREADVGHALRPEGVGDGDHIVPVRLVTTVPDAGVAESDRGDAVARGGQAPGVLVHVLEAAQESVAEHNERIGCICLRGRGIEEVLQAATASPSDLAEPDKC